MQKDNEIEEKSIKDSADGHSTLAEGLSNLQELDKINQIELNILEQT